MSNNLDSLSNPLNFQAIKEIDNLDLPIMQKHHVRILAHCLQILKIINADNSFEYQNKSPLREWCDNQFFYILMLPNQALSFFAIF